MSPQGGEQRGEAHCSGHELARRSLCSGPTPPPAGPWPLSQDWLTPGAVPARPGLPLALSGGR